MVRPSVLFKVRSKADFLRYFLREFLEKNDIDVVVEPTPKWTKMSQIDFEEIRCASLMVEEKHISQMNPYDGFHGDLPW